MVSRHGADFLEHFAPLLAKQLVAVIGVAVFGARHKTLVVADIVGKRAQEARAQNLKRACGRQIEPLHQNCGANIAKDKVAIAVFPGQVRRGDFGVDHQNRPRLAGADRVDGQFQRKRGRRTGHIHVERVALHTQRGLDFHAHRGVGALHIGSGANQAVHVGGGFASGVQRSLACVHANLGHHGNFGIRPGRKARAHAGRVKHAVLVHHVAALDT